eukprot:g16513.t1
MAKALLLNALHDALSDYVVGLSPERLKVGVWSGKIVLEELQVNPEAVNQLRLPVNIIHGTVKKLEVDIPWAHLGSRPVKVVLEGVSVLVGPVDRGSWGDDEVRERRLGIKRAALEKAEAASKKEGKGNDDDTRGFVEKLVQRIVDNIEINVADIHIRYEDAVLVPGQTVSVGVCLESFVVATTDKDFVPQFVDRTGKGGIQSKVHKLAQVKGFSVYWRVDDKERFELVPPEMRSTALRRFVEEQAVAPSEDDGGRLKRGDLIRPTGAVLRFTHSDDPEDKAGPKFEASFEMDDVKVDFHAEQYEQALSLKDSIAALANWQIFYPYRPKTTPLQDPKAWWRYAFVCTRGKPDGWTNLNKVLMARKEYVSVYSKVTADADKWNKSSKNRLSPLTAQEQRRLDELEEELPLQAVIMFRAMARKELQRKRAEERAKSGWQEDDPADKKSGGGGWWGSLFNGDKQKAREEDDVDIEDLTASFEGNVESRKVPPDYLQMRVTVRPQGSMRLYARRDLPLVEARMVAAATIELREDSSMAFSFRLSRLDVHDLFTQGAVFPHMLKVGGHEDGVDTNTPELSKAKAKVAAIAAAGAVGSIKKTKHSDRSEAVKGSGEEDVLVCVNVAMTKTALKIAVCALPTDVAYNREAVDAVVSIFSARPAETEAAMSSATKGLEAAQKKTKELAGLSISVSLDVAAPKIIVPVSSSRDNGFVLLDMGHMQVDGGTVKGGAMEYRAELSDVNVRLPAKKALLVNGTGDAVVEPFKIKVNTTIGGGEVAGVSKPTVGLAVEVMPGVKGVMSPAIISGLFRVLDYVTKADLKAEGGPGEPPIGLAAPNTAIGGGGLGVERLGEEGLIALGADEEPETEDQEDKGEKNQEPLVLLELHMKLPTVALLLVETDKEAANKNSGLLMEAAGMSMDVTTSRKDMTVQLHLDAVTLQDRARPDDSPFRNMIYSMPDEKSHGGLIHVTYWASAGGVRRVPPVSITATNQKYDMAVDARFSTLKMALDRDSVIKATPFYKAVTRQDTRQGPAAAAGSGRRSSKARSRMDDASSVVSAESLVVGAAKRMVESDNGPKAMLAMASLTSVLFELVRSDPWETVMRAGVSGLNARFISNEGGQGGMDAKVTLDDILLTDVRPEAKNNAYTMILAPLRPSVPAEVVASAAQDEKKDGTATREHGGSGLGQAGVGQEGGVGVERGHLIEVSASMDGESGDLDANVKLASFAYNLMVEPIKESLVVMNEVNAALLKMFASSADMGGTDSPAGGGETPRVGRMSSDSTQVLGAVDEEMESGSEVASTVDSSLAPVPGKNLAEASSFGVSPGMADYQRRDSGRAGGQGARGEMEELTKDSSPSSICARLGLDDWRINLIEEPAEASSKVVVLRASAMAIFTRSVTTGEGGDSVEDTLHLSLMKTESLVDNRAFDASIEDTGRKISQVLEPFSAEIHATLLSARGSLLSAKLHVMAEAVDARLSYMDMMLIKSIADQATASSGGESSARTSKDGSEHDPDNGQGMGLLPETYADASDPLAETREDARGAATRAVARAGLQPSTMAAISLAATCSMARVVLVNDYEGQGVPVLSFSSRGLKAEGSGFKEDYSVEVSGVMEAAYFNMRVVRWEPLCEPWQPVLTAVVGVNFKGRRTIQIKLACEEVVMFDITSDFMESFLSTYWMLFSEGVAKDDSLPLISEETENRIDEADEVEEASRSSSPEISEPKQLEWAEGAESLQELREGSVALTNRTGLQLLVSTTDFPAKTLHLGALDTVRLPFEAHRDRARAGQFDLRGKSTLVRWAEEDMQSAREELPPLQVDRTGVYVFPLLPNDSVPSGHVVSAPVVVEVYQSQRFNMGTRKWSAPYLLGDGPEFTYKDWRHADAKNNQETPLDSITLPDKNQWEWRDDWHVDFSKEVGTQIDAAGWEYAVEFGAFNLIASSRTRKNLDQARRRKWIRTRAPKPLPMNDPFRPLYVAWEVDVTPQGRLEAKIRSTIQVTNRTGLPLEVRALCSVWPVEDAENDEDASAPGPSSVKGLGKRSLGFVAPGSTLDVPVKMVYASHLQLRPVPSSSPHDDTFASIASQMEEGVQQKKLFEWSSPLPMLSNNVDTTRDDWVSCREVADGGSSSGRQTATLSTIRLVVHAETTAEGCVVVTVLPPVTVVNALPCPLSFRAFLPADAGARRGSSSSSVATAKQSPPKTLEVGRVLSAKTAYLHTLEVGDGAKFSIKIAHHRWSGAESLLPPTREELRSGLWANRVVTFRLPCSRGDGDGGSGVGRGGGYLEMKCHFEPRVTASCPALRLHVFCTHWLVDRSGLGLGFGVSEKHRLPVPVVRQNTAFELEDEEDNEAGGTGDVQPPLQVHVSPVEQLSCANTAGAVVTTASVGGRLYTDRDYVFEGDSLPRSFCGATMIRTACSDKRNASQHFLRFRVVEDSTVHVLFDRRCPSPPSWLTSGFRLTAMRVHVAHELSKKGKRAECPFVVWNRNVRAGSWVNLGGNKAKEADTMYLVVVTEEDVAVPTKVVTSKVGSSSSSSGSIKRKISSREDLMESWTLGTEGLSLCNSPEERVRVAVPEGAGRGNRGGGVYGHDGFGTYTRDAWSDELDVPGGANGVFQVNGTQGEVYELALRAEVCPGTFRRTTQVTVIPRYCVVNLLKDENIWLKEPGAPKSSAVCVPPGGRLPWHWMLGKSKNAGVRVRTEGTAWSYGDVVINRVGTTALHIPFFGEDEDLDGQYRGQAGGPPMKMPETFGGGHGSGGGKGGGKVKGGGPTGLDKLEGEQTVVHVDVQLPDQSFVDEYSLLVVFWKANERFAPIYSASNASPVTVRLHQTGADRDERQILSAKAVWKLQPGEQRQIGWAYPAAQRSLLISAGKGTRAVELSTDTVGNYAKIPTGLTRGLAAAASAGTAGGGKQSGPTGPSFVWASVIVKGATKVIHISSRAPLGSEARKGSGGGGDGKQQHEQQQNLEKEVASKRKRESEAPALELAVNMRGFGVSLIGPVSGRRQELIYSQVSNVRMKISRDRLSSVQASIGSLQVDSHLSDGIYPVLVSCKREEESSPPSGKGEEAQQETPFLQISIIKEVNQSTNTAHYDYVAFRMLEVDIMADRATLLNLLVWYKPVQGYLLMWRQQLDSSAWVTKRTAEVLDRGAQDVPGGFVDVGEVRRTARIQRKYFKTMRFHPIILRLSYARTPVSNALIEEAGMAIVNKIPSMVKSHVDLASYLVEDAFGSVRDISKNVVSHYTIEASMQVLNLVGSMRALGSPADLISNIGGGAKALVYAPAQGLVQGPAEFFEGVGRGAQSFVKGTVHGVFNSVAGVGGAVTDTVSKLTFDSEYQMKRERAKNKAIADQGGLGQGLKQGGKDIAGGFASGVSGIFSAPVTGAKKDGMGGFFKGVGKGLVGAVVKPVVGVTDSVISVAQGISNEAENAQRQEHLRPRRALTKDSETGQLVLTNFSVEAAEAQALVEKGSKDKYESHTQVSDLTIIFADQRVILVKRTKNDHLGSARVVDKAGAAKAMQMVSKRWEELASVDVIDESIVIRRYEGGNISLKAAVESSREELYRQFYVHRKKMGDPTSMLTPEKVFGTKASGAAPPLVMSMRAHSTAVQDSLSDYRFGSANRQRIPGHRMSDSQILDRAERQLQSVGVGNWNSLDDIAWELVQNWDSAHNGLNATRCLCVVFINASTSTMQFLEMRKRDGHGYRLLIGPLCNGDSQQLMPGGVAILFAWGHPSTNILKKGFVVMVAETTAFSGVFAVQREKVAMTSKSGFQAGFLEKTMHEWWSKQVVVVK